MNNRRRWISKMPVTTQVVLIVNLIIPSTAFAYVDPGSGSMIVTSVLGLMAVIGYVFRKYIHKLLNILHGKKAKKLPQDNE